MANKPGEANFFPDVPVYPEMGTFQPVYGKFDLTTYIQGASDYEIMAFLVGKYNACLEAYGNITKLSTETITACKQLQDWINSWFTNLDVQEEINKKLDSMVADGSFGTLLHQTFDAQVNQQAANTTTAWLVANVTPTGSAVIVDKSLTIKGAAADSYVTGTKLNAIAKITISANMMNPSKFQNGLIGYDYHDSVTNLSENPDYYSIIFDGTFPKGTVFLFSRELGTDYPYQRFIQFNPSTNIVTASYRVQDKGDTGLYEIATTEDNKGIAITFGKAYKDLYVATKSSYLENPKILPYGATDVELLADVGTDNLESKSVTAEKLNDDVIKLIKTKNDNPCDYEGGDISAFDTCVCIGDSLTEGIFNVNKLESSRTYPTMNYPSYLQKITGVNVTNNGSGGKTTVTWWNAFKNTDLSGYKMAIIALGVNDYYSYGADWTAAANEALGEIVQKLQNENNNIKIFVSTILPAKYYPASQYTKISQGIRDFVKNKNDANVICLDIAKYGHTNDKDAYNTGHLSAYGYWRLAKDYANYISWYMNNNSEVFKEIQFIGTDLTSGY